MPLFFPNRTKCALCNNVIEDSYDAFVLPYIHPKVSPSLSLLGRELVHYSCWTQWKYKSFFADAAYELVSKSDTKDSSWRKEFETDNLIVFRFGSINRYHIQDFSSLAIIEIPQNNYNNLTNFLISVFMEPHSSHSCQIKPYLWKTNLVNDLLVFELFVNSELKEKFFISLDRKDYWLAALEAIKIKESAITDLVD